MAFIYKVLLLICVVNCTFSKEYYLKLMRKNEESQRLIHQALNVNAELFEIIQQAGFCDGAYVFKEEIPASGRIAPLKTNEPAMDDGYDVLIRTTESISFHRNLTSYFNGFWEKNDGFMGINLLREFNTNFNCNLLEVLYQDLVGTWYQNFYHNFQMDSAPTYNIGWAYVTGNGSDILHQYRNAPFEQSCHSATESEARWWGRSCPTSTPTGDFSQFAGLMVPSTNGALHLKALKMQIKGCFHDE